MYIECCEGNLDPTWKVDEADRDSFQEFRQKLSEQMLRYDPREGKVPGDSGFRKSTQVHKKRRERRQAGEAGYDNRGLTVDNIKRAKLSSRICLTVDEAMEHLASMRRDSNSLPCEICGVNTCYKCNICGKRLCAFDKKKWNGARCALAFHNVSHFGIARCDFKPVHGKKKKEWVPANQYKMNRNKRDVELLEKKIQEEKEDDSQS